MPTSRKQKLRLGKVWGRSRAPAGMVLPGGPRSAPGRVSLPGGTARSRSQDRAARDLARLVTRPGRQRPTLPLRLASPPPPPRPPPRGPRSPRPLETASPAQLMPRPQPLPSLPPLPPYPGGSGHPSPTRACPTPVPRAGLRPGRGAGRPAGPELRVCLDPSPSAAPSALAPPRPRVTRRARTAPLGSRGRAHRLAPPHAAGPDARSFRSQGKGALRSSVPPRRCGPSGPRSLKLSSPPGGGRPGSRIPRLPFAFSSLREVRAFS